MPASGAWLTLTPSAAAVTTYDGESAAFTVTAKSSRNFDKQIKVGIFDGRSLISTNVVVETVSPIEYVAKLSTAAVLALGTHRTNLEVRLCEDDPLTCAVPLPGSPWSLPLTVTVKPATNLTQLSTLPGVAAWSTWRGNASHTGFVPASFATAAFNRRWSAVLGTELSLNDAATDGGKVFVTRGSYSTDWMLLALSEETGQILWSTNLGKLSRVNAPAAANGKIYVTSTGHQDTFFWIFDQASGALLAKTAMNSQWETYLAPTVYGDSVYTNSGSYGGLSKFSAADAKLDWFNNTLPQFDGWTPAVDDTHAYGYLSGSLYGIRTTDGVTAFTIANNYYSWHGYTGSAVVLGKQIGYVADSGRLLGFDLAKRNVAWSIQTGGNTMPALAADVLYATGANDSTFEARSAATGELLWLLNLAPERDERFSNIVVTSSHAFISSAERTVGIDLASRTPVWTMPFGGSLSISNRGVLYAVSPKGRIVAVNLQ